ncbi:hypothetical protein MF672_004260 [Actinomadura sp. ATCC 31491]|uniref:DUF5709 domain-containing protein n=1 Tax=Actinomadura luzonensis TaxID=2805427 RepID=A0ABT0FL08_9ACTN|nr:hypothetical protein [Actinomadura luzonensis]MCK2213012.1 hypothetical protein [Actinomadura luzonensis]
MDVREDEGPYEEEAAATELSIEAPEADAAEQHREVRHGASVPRRELPLDVDPADAAEQDRVVDLDDDEYR